MTSTIIPIYQVAATFFSNSKSGTILAVQKVTDLTNFTVPNGLTLSCFQYTTNNLNGTLLPASAYVLWPRFLLLLGYMAQVVLADTVLHQTTKFISTAGYCHTRLLMLASWPLRLIMLDLMSVNGEPALWFLMLGCSFLYTPMTLQRYRCCSYCLPGLDRRICCCRTLSGWSFSVCFCGTTNSYTSLWISSYHRHCTCRPTCWE